MLVLHENGLRDAKKGAAPDDRANIHMDYGMVKGGRARGDPTEETQERRRNRRDVAEEGGRGRQG